MMGFNSDDGVLENLELSDLGESRSYFTSKGEKNREQLRRMPLKIFKDDSRREMWIVERRGRAVRKGNFEMNLWRGW